MCMEENECVSVSGKQLALFGLVLFDCKLFKNKASSIISSPNVQDKTFHKFFKYENLSLGGIATGMWNTTSLLKFNGLTNLEEIYFDFNTVEELDPNKNSYNEIKNINQFTL